MTSPASPTDPIPGSDKTEPTSPTGPQIDPSADPSTQQVPKEFKGPESPPEAKPIEKSDQPSPMDAAKDSSRQSEQVSLDDLQNQAKDLQKKIADTNKKFNDPNYSSTLTPEHNKALSQVAGLMDRDLKTLSDVTENKHTPLDAEHPQGVKAALSQWLDGAQSTMGDVLNTLPDMKGGDMGQMMRLQMSMQRSAQRVELFASIIGATVGGIKTIMTTQLG